MHLSAECPIILDMEGNQANIEVTHHTTDDQYQVDYYVDGDMKGFDCYLNQDQMDQLVADYQKVDPSVDVTFDSVE